MGARYDAAQALIGTMDRRMLVEPKRRVPTAPAYSYRGHFRGRHETIDFAQLVSQSSRYFVGILSCGFIRDFGQEANMYWLIKQFVLTFAHIRKAHREIATRLNTVSTLKRKEVIFTGFILLIAQPSATRAEELLVSLSTQRLELTSNLPSTEVMLFGKIERQVVAPNLKIVIEIFGPQGFHQVMADGGTSFLTRTLFRSDIALPSDIPRGTYNIEIKLLAEGRLIASQKSKIEVVKAAN